MLGQCQWNAILFFSCDLRISGHIYFLMIWGSKNIPKTVVHSTSNNTHLKLFFTAILFTPSDNRMNNYRINNYHIYWASCILWPMHLHLIFKTKGFILWLFKLSAINSLPFLLTSLQIANCNIFYLNKDINKIYTPLSLKSDETVHVKTINNFILSIPQETFYLKDIPQHLTIDYNWLFTSLNSPPIPLDPTKFPYFSENLY